MYDIYIINLDRNKRDWNKIKKIIKESGNNPIRIPAVDSYLINNYNNSKTMMFKFFGNERLEAIYSSHMKVWNFIKNKKNNNRYSLILEDDARPIKNYEKKIVKILKNLPDNNWHILLLGCLGCCNEDNRCNNILDRFTKLFINNRKFKKKKKISNKYIFEPLIFSGAHAYIINNSKVNELIKEMSKINYHIDLAISNNTNIKKYASKKKIFIQDPSYSSYKNKKYDILNKIIIDKENKATLNWYLNMPLFNIGKIKITLLSLSIINIIFLLWILKTKKYKLFILLFILNIIALLIIISLVWIKI